MKNIIETSFGIPSLSTFVSALKGTDLIAVLAGPKEYTVFAPTNEAFAKIPADDLKAVLANKEKLTSILNYHVIPGTLMSEDVETMLDGATLEGKKLIFRNKKGVTVNHAKVIQTNIECTNGVIHTLDTVLLI